MKYLKEYNEPSNYYVEVDTFDLQDVINNSTLSLSDFNYLKSKFGHWIEFFTKNGIKKYSPVFKYEDDIIGILINASFYNSTKTSIVFNSINDIKSVWVYVGDDEWFWAIIESHASLRKNYYKCDQIEGLLKLIEDKL